MAGWLGGREKKEKGRRYMTVVVLYWCTFLCFWGGGFNGLGKVGRGRGKGASAGSVGYWVVSIQVLEILMLQFFDVCD